jgi:DNA-binding PadR family transcriptional regulator
MPAPHSRSTFLVLAALQDGAKHGYEISTHIREKSAGVLRLSFGALYPVLHRLEKDGLVEGHWQDIGEVKRKKVYVLTAKGRKALGAERRRYEDFAGALAKLLGGKA